MSSTTLDSMSPSSPQSPSFPASPASQSTYPPLPIKRHHTNQSTVASFFSFLKLSVVHNTHCKRNETIATPYPSPVEHEHEHESRVQVKHKRKKRRFKDVVGKVLFAFGKKQPDLHAEMKEIAVQTDIDVIPDAIDEELKHENSVLETFVLDSIPKRQKSLSSPPSIIIRLSKSPSNALTVPIPTLHKYHTRPTSPSLSSDDSVNCTIASEQLTAREFAELARMKVLFRSDEEEDETDRVNLSVLNTKSMISDATSMTSNKAVLASILDPDFFLPPSDATAERMFLDRRSSNAQSARNNSEGQGEREGGAIAGREGGTTGERTVLDQRSNNARSARNNSETIREGEREGGATVERMVLDQRSSNARSARINSETMGQGEMEGRETAMEEGVKAGGAPRDVRSRSPTPTRPTSNETQRSTATSTAIHKVGRFTVIVESPKDRDPTGNEKDNKGDVMEEFPELRRFKVGGMTA